MKIIRSKTFRIIFIVSLWLIGFSIGAVIKYSEAAETVILASDFDGVASGLDSGTEGYMIWENMGTANYFETSTDGDLTAPNSLKFYHLTGVAGGKGWLNLTEGFSYIKKINISFSITGLGTSNDFQMWFYLDGEIVFKYRITANRLSVYDDAGWEEVTPNLGNNRYYFLLTHTASNQFSSQVIDSTFANIQTEAVSSLNTDTWTSFDSIYINDPGTGSTTYTFYIDNFYLTTDTGETENDYGDITGFDSYCSGGLGMSTTVSWEEITYNIFGWETGRIWHYSQYVEHEFPYPLTADIYYIDLAISTDQYYYVSSDETDYHCYCNGIPLGTANAIFEYGSDYVIRWIETTPINLEGEKPIFSFKCDEYTEIVAGKQIYWYGIGITYSPLGYSGCHDSETLYQNNVFDGHYFGGHLSMCFYFNNSNVEQSEPEIPETDLDDYIDQYGSDDYNGTFIEFYKNWIPCFHGIGDNPYIMYYVNNTENILEEDSPYYMYEIRYAGSNRTFYRGLISIGNNQNKSAYFRIYSVEFLTSGDYYILLYKTTDYGTVGNTILYRSRIITVCDEGTGQVQDEPTETDEGEIENLNVIMGLGISFAIGIGLMVMTGSLTVFFAGTSCFLFVFSQPIGYLNLLPTEIGYGLIVVLVLVAVVVWLLS